MGHDDGLCLCCTRWEALSPALKRRWSRIRDLALAEAPRFGAYRPLGDVWLEVGPVAYGVACGLETVVTAIPFLLPMPDADATDVSMEVRERLILPAVVLVDGGLLRLALSVRAAAWTRWPERGAVQWRDPAGRWRARAPGSAGRTEVRDDPLSAYESVLADFDDLKRRHPTITVKTAARLLPVALRTLEKYLKLRRDADQSLKT